MRKTSIILVIGLMAVACALIAGCNGTGVDGSSVEKEATIVSTPYGTAQSSPYVLKEVDVGIAWAAVASGDVDFIADAWLPTCHGNYLEKYEGEIDLVRTNLIGTRCGLAVPQYVPIDSIDELNNARDRFDGTIIGVEPGAGIMQSTDEAIEEYGLRVYPQGRDSKTRCLISTRFWNASPGRLTRGLGDVRTTWKSMA